MNYLYVGPCVIVHFCFYICNCI